MWPVDVELPPQLYLENCRQGLLPAEVLVQPGAARIRVSAPMPFQHAEPFAVAMLGAWAAQVRAGGATVEFGPGLQTPGAYRTGVLSALSGRFGHTTGLAPGLVQRHVAAQEEIASVLGKLRSHLELHDRDTVEAVGYCLDELLRNVFEHAGGCLGAFVAAARVANSKRFSFAVADAGITLGTHYRRRWPQIGDDRSAVELALEPSSSGSDDRDRNAGMGLYMTRRAVALLGGRTFLRAGAVLAESAEAGQVDGGPSRVVCTDREPFWPGTMVGFTVEAGLVGDFARAFAAINEPLDRDDAPGIEFRARPPVGAAVIPVLAGGLATDKILAARLRDELLMPAVAAGGPIALDFRGVQLATQSFAHALLAKPLRLSLASRAGLRVTIVGASPQLRQVLRLVASYLRDEAEAHADAVPDAT